MIMLLAVLCIVLCALILVLALKIRLLHQAADELRVSFAGKTESDSNVGLDICSQDRHMKQLAAELDRQLKVLRAAQLRYINGDQELKNAVTNISHDLRTPLTAICGYMDLLLADSTVPEPVKKDLGIIDNRIQAMKALTEELFSYSVVLADDAGSKPAPVSLNAALEDCIAAYYGAFMESGIAPEIELPPAPVVRQLDGQALSRILSNIVSNAIKYSDGDFYVRLSPDGEIQFQNHAAALDEVSVGHLFERFFTVNSAKASTGLGLSIARTLTEAQGGRLAAAYENGMLSVFLVF